MRRRPLLCLLFSLAACGGSSHTERRNGGEDSGGSAGTRNKGGDAASGVGGTSAGGDAAGGSLVGKGGTFEKGGTAGTGIDEGGEPGVGGGVGAVGGKGGAGKGGTSGGVGASSGRGGMGGSAAMPAITSCTDEFPFTGVWEGHILDFYFEAVDDLSLAVTPDEELGGYKATVTWGSGDPPPPVRSGDEPYPSAEYWQSHGDIDGTGSIEQWPGFGYSVVRGAGCDQVFRVSVSLAEPWDEWCSLQMPVCTADYGCGCIYQGGGSSNNTTCDVQDGRGNVLATYPLWRCQMCGRFEDGVCECDEASCSFNHMITQTFDLELIQSGGVDVLTGPDPDPSCGDCTVRLERVE